VKANQADATAHLPVRKMCRVLGVSASGYYDWLGRQPSARQRANDQLVHDIRAVHELSDGTYGRPRVCAELRAQGQHVNAKRVGALMRAHGIRGVSRRRGFVVTTQRDPAKPPKAPDLVQRRFVADGPNRLWVADMTYVPTWAGFIYLAVVLDVWSRRIVGWAIGEQMRAELVLAALDMALEQRRTQGVIHHSDQGSQYTSVEFGKRCQDMGVQPSMGSVGDAYDNAMAESFFASLECELIDRRSWPSKAQARMALFTYIEGWYNPRRRHSALGQRSPMEFEEINADAFALEGRCDEHGLPNGCFAPVDKPPSRRSKGPSACPQASPLDNPASEVIDTD
jgi:putative transposase